MIYLLLGPEEGEKQEWLDREKNRLRSLYPDMETTTYFGGDEDGTELAATLSQSSLFSSFRLVIFKHYENVKKTDECARVMADFANEDQADAELIVLSSETNTSNFPTEVVNAAKNTTEKFWEMDEGRKKAWIRNTAKKEGFIISNAAIDEILYSVENNTAEMKNLLSSLVLFLRLNKDHGNTIELDDIETYTTRTKGETGYTLFRAIASLDLENALLIVNSILLSDIRDAIPAFTVVSNQFRLLEACLQLKKKGMMERDIFKDVTYVSTSSFQRKTTGIFFKEQDTFRKAMYNYALDDVKSIILYTSRMDSEIKSASTDMTKIIFENVIYNIIVNKGRETKLSVDSISL